MSIDNEKFQAASLSTIIKGAVTHKIYTLWLALIVVGVLNCATIQKKSMLRY